VQDTANLTTKFRGDKVQQISLTAGAQYLFCEYEHSLWQKYCKNFHQLYQQSKV